MSSDIQALIESAPSEHVVVSAGVDWITCTGETWNSKERVGAMATALLDDGMLMGQKLFRQSRSGYHLSCIDGIQWGSGTRGWMVCLHGELARKHWMTFYVYAKNCSRIDVQTTVRYKNYHPGIIQDMYQSGQKEVGNKWLNHATLILNTKKGSTLYYGSRTSAQFGRIYDKAKRSNGEELFDNSIRFEVEYKKPLSGQVAAWLCDKSPDMAGITDHVLTWFSERGINCPRVFSTADNAIQFPKGGKGIEEKLAWLKKSIAPTYKQLVLAGYQTEADDALGVTEQAKNVD